MAPIVLGAQNLVGSGARVFGLDLIPPLVRELHCHDVLALLPDSSDFRNLDLPRNVQLRYFHSGGAWNGLKRLWQLHAALPRLQRRTDASAWLTLGDLGPIRLLARHCIFVHQPLFVYGEDELPGRQGWSPAKRAYAAWHLRASARRASRVIVQTDVMAERLIARFHLSPRTVRVIRPPAPSMRGSDPAPAPLGQCPKPVRLLFLAQYYAHKNHAILPAVAAELKRRGLDKMVQVFLTVDESTLPKSSRAELQRSPDLVTNLGPIRREQLLRTFQDVSALLLPTLAESLGLVYLEAMCCGTPILTSDRDFSREVCRDTAIYFNPLEAPSIVDAIEQLAAGGFPNFTCRASENLQRFSSDWGEVAREFARELLP